MSDMSHNYEGMDSLNTYDESTKKIIDVSKRYYHIDQLKGRTKQDEKLPMVRMSKIQ